MLARRTCLVICVLLAVSGSAHAETAPTVTVGFKPLLAGLDYGEFLTHAPTARGDATIRVLRMDPNLYELRLLMASEQANKKGRTLPEWVQSEGLLAAINASMFQKDLLTSIGLLKSAQHTNFKTLTKGMSILAFGPKRAGLPPVRLIDRECDDFDTLKEQYKNFVQNIRMLSCKGQNTWSQQPGKSWSIAAVAVDKQGRVLFIHGRSPYTVHDFIEELKGLPLAIERAMYTEGGGPSGLVIKVGSQEIQSLGWSGGFDSNVILTPLPNVLGIVAKAQ